MVSCGVQINVVAYSNCLHNRTPFHSDVLGTFSWSTNIVGCKKWLLLVPGEELKLVDRFGQPPFAIDENALRSHQVRYFVVHQEADETLFVPSGWWHQVSNETDTISVNHNWLNACNVSAVWNGICENYASVKREIDDCRDMDGFEVHCQLMLKAVHGMNFVEFLDMLETVATRRMEIGQSFDGFSFGPKYCTFDLQTICTMVDEVRLKLCVANERDEDDVSRSVQVQRCNLILERVKDFLATNCL